VGHAPRAGEAAKLNDLVERAKEDPALQLRCEGHASAEGTAALNQSLAAARAETVRKLLFAKGVAPPSRVAAKGLGTSQPAVAEDGPNPKALEEQRRQNRRVEITLVAGPAPAPSNGWTFDPRRQQTVEEKWAEWVKENKKQLKKPPIFLPEPPVPPLPPWIWKEMPRPNTPEWDRFVEKVKKWLEENHIHAESVEDFLKEILPGNKENPSHLPPTDSPDWRRPKSPDQSRP
jgi:hypothetical protein